MKFKASLDRTTKSITSLVIVVILLVICLNLFSKPEPSSVHQATSIILAGGLMMMYAFSIKGYTVELDHLVINRVKGNRAIFYSEIQSAIALKDSELEGTIRTFGNGGFLGYTGHFRNPNLGNYKMYATQRKNYILIELGDGRKIVLTPDEPEAFLQNLSERMG